MPLLWSIAMCLMAMSTVANAQGQAHIHLGPVLGYRSVDAAFSGGLENQRISDPGTTLATFTGISLGASSPVSSDLALRFDLESFWGWGSASTTRDVTFIVGGVPTIGSIRTDHDITTSWLMLDAGIDWKVAEKVTVGFVVGSQFVNTLDGTWTETIESPPGATFVSNGQNTRTFDNVGTEGSLGSPSFIGGFNVSTTVPIATKLDLTPMLRFRYSITEAVTNSGWHPFDIALGVNLAIPVKPYQRPSQSAAPSQAPSQSPSQSAAPSPAPFQATFREDDTVTIVDAFVPGRVDTLWSSRERLLIDTVKGDLVDTIITTTFTSVERHLPGPPPFLSTILDVTIDQNSIDSVAVVRISAEIESDASTTTDLRAIVDSVVTWSSTHLAKNIRQNIPLTTIVPDVKRRNTMEIEFQAVTTDAYGQKKEAVPKRVVLKRLPTSGRLQRE